MNIAAPNRDHLSDRSNRLDQLVNVWKAFRNGANEIRRDQYCLEGVELSDSDDTLKFTVSYRWIGIEFVFSTYAGDRGLRGRVTVVLSKHPIDESRPVLGYFDLTWDGMTDINVDGRMLGAESSAAWVASAAIDKALTQERPAKLKTGVFM